MLSIHLTENDWTPEGPNVKTTHVTIDDTRAYTSYRGSLTQGTSYSAVGFDHIKRVLDTCRASVVVAGSHPMNKDQAGLIVVEQGGTKVYQRGCWHQKYAREYPAINAPETALAVAIVDYIEGGDTPIGVIFDLITDTECANVA